jgi:hypothetical protein
MRKYRIYLPNFIRMLFPGRWQKARLMAWLNAIIAPIKRMNADFDTARDEVLYKLAHGPQVVHIEAVLNDRWDNIDRRIKVEDGAGFEPLPIYRDAETKTPPYIYKEAEGKPNPYIYQEMEIDGVSIDFVIKIPVAIVFDMDELKALVDTYRLAGKVYIVETV